MDAKHEEAPSPNRRQVSRRAFLARVASVGGMALVSAACGAQVPSTAQPAATSAPAPAQPAATTPPAAAEKVTIRLASVGWGGSLSEPFKSIIKDFNASQSRIVVPEYEDIEDYPKVMTQAASNAAADVYLFENKFMPGFAARGFFLPLEEYAAKSSVVKKDDFFETDWKSTFYRDHQYLVPFDNSPSALYYNPDLFDKAGVSYPPAKPGEWKWEDFLAASQKLTTGEGANKTFGWMSAGVRFMHLWIWNNGGSFLNDTLNKCIVDSPEAIEAVQWAADLIAKHNVAPLPAQIPQDMGREAMFQAGRVAMTESGPFFTVALKQQTAVKWNIAPHPAGKGGMWVRNPLDAWGIWLGSRHPDAAWEFIGFLSTDESVKKLTAAGFSPSKKALLHSDSFLKQEPQNVNWPLFVDLLENHTRQMPDTPIYAQQEDAFQKAWDAIIAGSTTAKDAMPQLAKDVNALFDECRAQGYCS
jgi:multiple sugar transport system substrate-binding protein